MKRPKSSGATSRWATRRSACSRAASPILPRSNVPIAPKATASSRPGLITPAGARGARRGFHAAAPAAWSAACACARDAGSLMSVCLRRIEDTTPARSCRLSSTSNALQCLADQFGCECRQFGIRNSNDAFTPHLESRRVEAISISRHPSPARISTSCPGLRPSASRRALGTTMRPALSMVAFTAFRMPQQSQRRTLLHPRKTD